MSNLFGGTPLPGRFDKVEKADLTGVTQVASTMDVRDKEMARRFERAENLRRTDINEAVGYDLAGIGQFGSEIFQQEANEVSEMIANGELDPTQARMRLGQLKGMYNQFKTHADAISAEDEIAKKLALDPEARKAKNASLGLGEELSYGLDDYAATHHTAMNNVFKPGSAQKGPDGQWTAVDPRTGQRVPLTQLQGFANPSLFYQYGTKSVDVGTLGDWAQNKATASAISFKDGKWNEVRARDFYRDNVLTEDDNGRTHRLQLLGTLEDRGLIDHLSDDEKKQFRDGVNLTSEKFQDIITKGEDEFVTRSQFEGTYGTKGKGSGSGSGDDDTKKDFVVGGLNVASKSTGELLSNLVGLGTASHNLNRFNKPPVLEGAFDVPGKPNTENIQIVGAGVNEKGEQVAYIRGKQRVEVEGAIPGIEGESDLVPYFKEIPIGGSATGVGSDVMREIQQNHPEMYQQILQDQDAYEENKLRGRGVRPSSAQTGGPATPDTGDAADRGEASLGARDAAVDEYRNLADEYAKLNKQINAYPNTAPAAIAKQRRLKERMDAITGGEFGEYVSNVFAEASEGGAPGETPDELRPFDDSVETQEEQAERVRSEARQNVADTFFDNPIGRLFGYQGPEARAQAAADEARRSTRTTSKPIQVPQDQVADLRETLSPTMQDKLDRALDEAVRRGADGIGARRNENGDIVVTDRRGVPVPGVSTIVTAESREARPAGEVPNPALERSPEARTEPSDLTGPFRPTEEAPEERVSRASELAINLVGEGAGSQDGGIGSYEGYSEGLQINVPDTTGSGVTIAGLDIGDGAEGKDGKLAILKDYLTPEDYKLVESLKGLKGPAAQQALAKLQDEGKLLKDGLGLTQEDLNEITARQADKEIKDVYKFIPKDKFAQLPLAVQRGVAGVEFNVHGPNSMRSVRKAIESGKTEDWQAAANNYMNFFSSLGSPSKEQGKKWRKEFTEWAEQNGRSDLISMIDGSKTQEFKDAVVEWKIDSKKIGRGNVTRAEDTAQAIIKEYGLDPVPSFAERTASRAGSEDVAVN